MTDLGTAEPKLKSAKKLIKRGDLESLETAKAHLLDVMDILLGYVEEVEELLFDVEDKIKEMEKEVEEK